MAYTMWKHFLLLVCVMCSKICKTDNQTCAGYQCNDTSLCISKDWKCDRQMDCPKGDDEEGCSSFCNPTSEFKCHDFDCIEIEYKCDGQNDCYDGSDELNCSKIECDYDAGEKMCSDGECIIDTFWCDGYPNCNDKSDEVNCTSTKSATACSPAEFQCHLPVMDVKCIPIAWKCDAIEDCRDGSDEFYCTHHTCSADEKMCSNSQCIKATYFCDGNDDCGDGSDERNCSHKTTASDTKQPLQTIDSTQPDGSDTNKSISLSTQTVTTTSSKVEVACKSEEVEVTSKPEEVGKTSKAEEVEATSKAEEAMSVSEKTRTEQMKHKEESAGYVDAVVILGLLCVGLVSLVAYLLVKRHKTRNVKSVNCDSPVYRKTTTEEQLIMEKNGSRSNLPRSMQPLNQDNDVV